MTRKFSRPIKRIVVKLGSSQIADFKMQPRTAQLSFLMEQIKQLHQRGIEVVLVSSGAIVLGMGELGEKKRPVQLAALQARAAIGQAVLMYTYRELFKKLNLRCAQVLLTWDDFTSRQRYLNAKHTLNAILDQGVVPVINENDTIATDEIKFGDNDKLSALVASLIDADLLVILSDVDGLYDQNKKVFEEVKEITPEIESVAGGTKNVQMSKGGMLTKIEAIEIATHAKIPCVITSGATTNVLIRLIEGERIGTLFVEKEKKILAHLHWVAFGARPKGTVFIDEGAQKALKNGKSLLLPGLKGFEGNFKAEDVVFIANLQGERLARGVINYSIGDLHKIEEKKGKVEVVHRDHLIFMKD